MKSKIVGLVLAGAIFCSITAYAHHSFAGVYDMSKQIKIDGKLVQLLWRNPHSFVHVTAPDENGQVQRWSIEWLGTAQISGQGIANKLAVGDPVIVTGNPTRTSGEHRMRLVTLTRTTDGFTWGRRPSEVVD